MNNTEKFLIDVLRCFVEGTETKLNTEGVNPHQLLSLSKQHSVAGVVAYMLSKQNAFWDKETEKQFLKEYERTLMQMLSRESSAVKLCDKLTQMGIPHILFKGMTVSEAYPVAALRTYGDVDIIVKKDDVPAIRKFMVEDGFEHSLTDEGVVNAFKRGRERYEIHTALNMSNLRVAEFFTEIWENAVLRQGETYVFNHNFHLSYLICHLEKHVYGSGAGVRMYLDIALYLKKFAQELDLDFVRNTLDHCGLGEFLNTAFYLCNKWFDAEIPAWVVPMDDKLYSDMCDFVFSGGVFGEQTIDDILRDDLRREMASGKKGAKFRYILHRVFPTAHELCRMFPRFEGKPLLLPCAWLCHVGRVIFTGKISNMSKVMKTDADVSQAKKEFLERIGSRR